MARHQTSQPRHNIVMGTDQVLTFNRTNSSVAWRCYLFLNMQRRYFIILLGVSEPGWAGGGLASARAVIGHTHANTGS